MSSSDKKIVLPSVTRHPAKRRGPLRSDDYNDFHEEVVKDITNMSSAINSLYGLLARSMVVIDNEASYLKRQLRALSNQKEYSEKVSVINGIMACRYLDMGDTSGISFPNDLNDDHSAMLHATYGEVTLPPTSIENKFYTTSLSNGLVITAPDLTIQVKGTFDKVDGEGVVNYERGGKVTPGDPTQAFNGDNESYWVRRVEFPIDSKVDQVECEVTVTVPEGVSTQANTIEVVPFPNGSVDITELAVASDLGDNFIRVSGFNPEDNLISKRFHFPVRTVDQIKIRLRQRNWKEENGKKVFYYGLQELGLKLIDYDRTYSPAAAFGANNSFVIRIPAPEGYGFRNIYRVDPNPNFLSEDSGKRHIHMRIGTSEEYSIGTLWDSDTMFSPQQLSTPIAAGSSDTLYAFIQMNYVDSSGGNLSPFLIGTTPYIRGIGLTYDLVKL